MRMPNCDLSNALVTNDCIPGATDGEIWDVIMGRLEKANSVYDFKQAVIQALEELYFRIETDNAVPPTKMDVV